MEQKEMTGAALAKKLDCSETVLSRYRQGRCFPSLERFFTILDAMGLEFVIRKKEKK
jgi:transcriptional regulator with XRE-family HTH domain